MNYAEPTTVNRWFPPVTSISRMRFGPRQTRLRLSPQEKELFTIQGESRLCSTHPCAWHWWGLRSAFHAWMELSGWMEEEYRATLKEWLRYYYNVYLWQRIPECDHKRLARSRLYAHFDEIF